MYNKVPKNKINELGKLIHEMSRALSFTILEIGAAPSEDQPEPAHHLLEIFPGSKIIAFEIDAQLCEELNKKAKPGLKFYPAALGKKEERRKFYETVDPTCCSLYRPNEALLKQYNNMEVSMLKSETLIETVSMDFFMKKNKIEDVDFIKIDIQGAELDVFKGGLKTLRDVTVIVSEVEFISQYIDQPLFGDVCRFLTKQNFMFQKFLGMGGRALKPVIFQNNPHFPSQYIWTDAVFIRDIQRLPDLPSDKLLKMAVLSFLYGGLDVSYYCISLFDEKNQTNYRQDFTKILSGV